MSKITQLHVYIIGAVLLLIVGVGLFYTVIRPLDLEAKALDGKIQSKEGEISAAKKSDRDATAAAAKLVKDRSDLTRLMSTRTLPASQAIDLKDGSPNQVVQHTLPKWFHLPVYVKDTLESYGRKIALKNKVQAIVSFQSPVPSADPNSIPRDIIAWPMGRMTVVGRFENVMAWVKDWNHSPIPVSLDGLRCTLAGDRGRIVAETALNAYIFPSGNLAAQQQQGGAPAGGGMGGGYPGGGGGGYPGGGGMSGGMSSGMSGGMSSGMSGGMSGGYPGGGGGGYPGR